jgi:tetratricopeptide (TPR) repeat protein
VTSPGAQAEPRPPGSFVGRKRELAELSRGLADIAAGHSHLFLLSGEPGIGKTRLADEFGRLAVAQGVRVIWGRCWAGAGAPPYWPWIQVVSACLADTDAEQRSAILGSEATPQVAQDIAQLLPELRGAHPTPRLRGSQPTDPEQARFQLFESVATVLKNVARIQPLVIVIDDLHDADHPSLVLLKFIAGHSKGTRILMLATYRDTDVRQSQELTGLIGDLSREGHLLLIPGLSEAEVGQFVASSWGRNAEAKLVADLYQSTDGNPLFVDGVVRLMVAEGRVDRAEAGDAFRIPHEVQESIRRRLARMSEETNRMLSIASVSGNEVETEVLAQVSSSTAEEIVERMDGALRAGIVVDFGSHYRFSHALVREALYRALAPKRRLQLHAEIGAAIEEFHKADRRPHLAALAHHFTVVGDARKAIDYSIAAADAAEDVFAYEDALLHLRTALKIAERHNLGRGERAAVLFRLGRIIVFFENHEQGVAHLENALRIFEQIGDNQHAGEIHSHLGRALGALGHQMDVRRALIHLQRAEILLAGNDDSHSLGMLYWGLAVAYFEALRVDEALSASQKAMDILVRLGDRESWASVTGNHSRFLMVKGRLSEAVRLLDEIGQAAGEFVNPDVFPHMAWSRAWFRLLLRDPREATNLYRLGLKRPGLMPRLRESLVEFLTQSEMFAGNLTEARRLAAGITVNDLFRSRIEFYQGDWKAAEEALEKHLHWVQRIGSTWNELITLSEYVVELRRVTGDYPGAAAALKRAMSLYQPEDLFWEALIRPQGVMLFFDTGQPDKAAEHLELCRKILAGREDWMGLGGALWRADAIGAALQNRSEESDRYFEKSKEICERYSLPWEEAETLHYWGKALQHGGQLGRAREKLDAAIELYRDHGGGQAWIDRVEADRRRAQPRSGEPQAQSKSADAETASQDAIFRNEGDFWTIFYLDRNFRLKDMRGLHYIAHLLAHPNERLHVRELSASVGGDALSAATSDPAIHAEREDAPPILDSKAKTDYRAHLVELRADLDEAERMNDTGRAERIRQELEFVNDELSAAVGLGGRDRKLSDPAERTRVRIGKAIRSALSAIRDHDTSLAHHLTTCIRTGYYCAYLPDPRQLPSWKL